MEIITAITTTISAIAIPIFIYIVRIEKKLSRLETKIEHISYVVGKN